MAKNKIILTFSDQIMLIVMTNIYIMLSVWQLLFVEHIAIYLFVKPSFLCLVSVGRLLLPLTLMKYPPSRAQLPSVHCSCNPQELKYNFCTNPSSWPPLLIRQTPWLNLCVGTSPSMSTKAIRIFPWLGDKNYLLSSLRNREFLSPLKPSPAVWFSDMHNGFM